MLIQQPRNPIVKRDERVMSMSHRTQRMRSGSNRIRIGRQRRHAIGKHPLHRLQHGTLRRIGARMTRRNRRKVIGVVGQHGRHGRLQHVQNLQRVHGTSLAILTNLMVLTGT